MKILEREEALKLRKEGHSLGEISKKLGVSKSTASLWTKDVELTLNGKLRVEERRKLNMDKGHNILRQMKLERLLKAEKAAEKIISKIKDTPDINICILSMIYQCEGVKDGRTVCFVNSDPTMVKVFIRLLRKSFTIDENKLRALVHLHDYHNEIKMINFWSDITDIPGDRFYKSFKKQSNHLYKKENYMGCIHIYYHDAHVTRVILAVAKNLMKLYI